MLQVAPGRGQQEKHGAQSHDGEDVAGVDKERIRRYGDDGRHGIEGEHDVGDLDDDEAEEKRGRLPSGIPSVFADTHEKVMPVHLRMDRHEFLRPAHCPMLCVVDVLFLRLPQGTEHLPCRPQDEYAESRKGVGTEQRDDGTACRDEEQAHDHGAQDPVVQDAVLEPVFDGEG